MKPIDRPHPETRATRATRGSKRRRRHAPLIVAAVLAFAACSSDGTSVSAEGDPAANRVDATTTSEVPAPTTTTVETTTTQPPATTTTVPDPTVAVSGGETTTTTTSPADAPCPPRDGEPVEYFVGFHEYPEGLEVGDEFACGTVTHTEPRDPSNISVDVWDPEDFERRTQDDPNIRYVERNDYGGGACSAHGCPGNPPA